VAKKNPWGTGPKPPGWGVTIGGVPQWGTGTRGAARYENDPIFRNSANQALSLARAFRTGATGAPAPPGGGGGNPYGGILSEFLNSSKARFAADSAADAASRDAALRRYVISYGQVPDFDKLGISGSARGFLEKALDQKTKDLALANTKEGTSVYARQAKANEVANRRIPAQLAARGMLRSGQTGSDLQDQAQNYKIQGFDTLNEMLGSVEGTVGNFLAAERARADALAQAELQAQMAAMENYGGDMYGDPQTPANWRDTVLGTRPQTSVWKPPPRTAPVYFGGNQKKRVLTTATAKNRRK